MKFLKTLNQRSSNSWPLITPLMLKPSKFFFRNGLSHFTLKTISCDSSATNRNNYFPWRTFFPFSLSPFFYPLIFFISQYTIWWTLYHINKLESSYCCILMLIFNRIYKFNLWKTLTYSDKFPSFFILPHTRYLLL